MKTSLIISIALIYFFYLAIIGYIFNVADKIQKDQDTSFLRSQTHLALFIIYNLLTIIISLIILGVIFKNLKNQRNVPEEPIYEHQAEYSEIIETEGSYMREQSSNKPYLYIGILALVSIGLSFGSIIDSKNYKVLYATATSSLVLLMSSIPFANQILRKNSYN